MVASGTTVPETQTVQLLSTWPAIWKLGDVLAPLATDTMKGWQFVLLVGVRYKRTTGLV